LNSQNCEERYTEEDPPRNPTQNGKDCETFSFALTIKKSGGKKNSKHFAGAGRAENSVLDQGGGKTRCRGTFCASRRKNPEEKEGRSGRGKRFQTFFGLPNDNGEHRIFRPKGERAN